MRVLSKVSIIDWQVEEVTKHLLERKLRFDSYISEGLTTDFIDGFVVDKNHINGLEVHIITQDAFLFIFNLNSKRLITVLAPRPKQIKRYYEPLNLRWDVNIVNKANINFQKGLNNL